MIFDGVPDESCLFHCPRSQHRANKCRLLHRHAAEGILMPAHGGGNDSLAPLSSGAGIVQSGCYMVSGSFHSYEGRCRTKLMGREIYVAMSSAPHFLKWSETQIIFGPTDHPEQVP